MKGLIAVLVVIAVMVAVLFGMYAQYSNREVELKNLAASQQEANKVIFDSVWKIIAQKAEVSEKYKESFQKIYTDLMTKRYEGGDNLLMKWIQEQNPNFDSGFYKSIMDTVQGKREEFAQVQIKLRDIKREHDNLRTTIPAMWFVGSRPELKVVLVTSEKTDAVFAVGKEEDVFVFKK